MMEDSVKMEEFCYNSPFLDNYLMSDDASMLREEVLEYSEVGDKSSSLGFTELLNMQDFGPSLFGVSQPLNNNIHSVVRRSKDLMNNNNAPTTPNSSSVSSESNDEHAKDGDDEDELEEDDKKRTTKKQLKPKKINQKRKREPRFAFMTKSEVDHLEDGYRWRKYGQKAVKNSAFPRSYYRCTSAACTVKKRVERCWTDPTIVVTTYEGQHTHPSPMMQRPSSGGGAWGFSGNSLIPTAQMATLFHHSQQGFGQQQAASHQLLTDYGLLQDVVPSGLIKKEN